ncbi:MAG TPA: M48 family metalloprotease [Tepidisphaeraceae bacterium]|nr:M48 family metalloprotease [Tepidisphaeraceae bacterium]
MSQFGYDNYGGRRSTFGLGRLLIAVVIAIGGIIAFYSHTEVNPVTGERQHIGMNVDQEKSLGLQAAPQMAQEMGGAIDPAGDPDAAKVAQIGALIVQRSDASKSPYVGNFHFHLLKDPQTVNAFALPGGQIFITRALYDKLENEAQLAGVLGHETGHVINRHAAEHMAKGQLGQALVTAVGIGASDDRDNRGQLAAYAAMMANQMLQLKYSRTDELEADKYGLKYMSQAGFTPAAMLDVMKILKAVSGTRGGSQIFATHPDPDARMEQIEQYLKENPPSSDLSTGKPLR